MSRTGTRPLELNNTIYEIYTYSIDRATNAWNNSKYNNIIFLTWVPSHALNLYSSKMIVIKSTWPEAS